MKALEKPNAIIDADMGTRYEIRVQAIIDESWADWFGGMTFRREDEITVIEGCFADQSALYGILNRILDLNIKLISVCRLEGVPDETAKEAGI